MGLEVGSYRGGGEMLGLEEMGWGRCLDGVRVEVEN